MSFSLFENNIYLINLDSQPQKYSTTLKHLAAENIYPQRFSAINGNQMNFLEKIRHSNLVNSLLCPSAAFGCALSHFSLWRKIVEEDIPYAIILEDDVRPVKNLIEIFNRIYPEIPENWDLVYLGCQGACHRESNNLLHLLGRKTIQVSPNLIVPQFVGGAYSYMLSYRGAKKLLHLLETPMWHVDCQMSYYLPSLNAYALVDKLFKTDLSISTTQAGNYYLVNKLLTMRNNPEDPPYSWYLQSKVIRIPILNLSLNAVTIGILLTLMLLYHFRVLPKIQQPVLIYLLIVIINFILTGKASNYRDYWKQFTLLIVGLGIIFYATKRTQSI